MFASQAPPDAIKGLSVVATEQMEKDPLSGALFLFCNRCWSVPAAPARTCIQHRRIMKALYWDKNGFCLWQKKLEKDRFPWPQTAEAAKSISAGELRMLLEGIDFSHAHESLPYRSVS